MDRPEREFWKLIHMKKIGADVCKMRKRQSKLRCKQIIVSCRAVEVPLSLIAVAEVRGGSQANGDNSKQNSFRSMDQFTQVNVKAFRYFFPNRYLHQSIVSRHRNIKFSIIIESMWYKNRFTCNVLSDINFHNCFYYVVYSFVIICSFVPFYFFCEIWNFEQVI